MTSKIAISLPDELVAAAREAVADGRAASVSALVAQALREHLERPTLTDIVAEMVAEVGEPDASDRAWAAEALRGGTRSQAVAGA
ncbi:Ribbon-helix-helix protein, copG family [Quadrisphaera granulorum]|uniref:Ribbon-helix-helix CopG family protein n=1 Tax=Quadrisphaera granulorum TaxID=317664 RepID=A0A316AAF2_9ACTN|nr:ribbon-helix-helix protein, CopG family [Quadrisphaera granulorum]PWJ54601.1 ribbon-helix-helix CopG family protein [Quadrisphaera granulorum]SZE95963.1 Ribbon-helix-helix protein, copG family [Quadrisphaera granulorum]